jgi:hypothetical protein
VFARGPAAEVPARDEYAAAVGVRAIERKIGASLTRRIETQVMEKVLAQAFARGGREKARGYDLVGVDVPGRKYDGPGPKFAQACHRRPSGQCIR